MENIYIFTFENNNKAMFLHAACTNLPSLIKCIKLRHENLDEDDINTITKLLSQNMRASIDTPDGIIRIWQLEVNQQYGIIIQHG